MEDFILYPEHDVCKIGKLMKTCIRPGKYLYSGSDTPEQAKLAKISEYADDAVEYGINSYGYRTEEFEQVQNDNAVVIAFFGDSNTFGVGLRENEIYHHQIGRELRKRGHDVRIINFGIGGSGPDSHAMLVHQALSFMRIDIVVVLWSYNNRMMVVDPFGSTDAPNFLLPNNELTGVFRPIYSAYMRLATIEKLNVVRFASAFNLVNETCLARKTPYLWSSLDLDIDQLLGVYVPTHNYLGTSLEFLDYARDGMHFGKKSHEVMAMRFLPRIESEVRKIASARR